MDNQKIYDKIYKSLVLFASINNANVLKISNSPDKVEIEIKKNGEVIVVLCLYGNANECVPAGLISDLHKKFHSLMITALTDGRHFSFFDHEHVQYGFSDFEGMMKKLKRLIMKANVNNCQVDTHPTITSLTGLSMFTGIEHYSYGDKDILVFDDHRTSLGVIYEASKLGMFGEQIPNLVTFDYHEDCCDAGKQSELLKKIGVENLMDATSRQFWSFVEFDLSKVDDDWIAAAQELNLVKDVTIIGNEANHNVDNNEVIVDESGNQHRRFSIPHLSFSLGNRGCLGDSMLKEPYYQAIRDTFQIKNGRFDNAPVYPYVLDIDLDCFTGEIREKTMRWPEQVFFNEFMGNHKTRRFLTALIERASFVTISREPRCCGGMGESNKILQYIDRHWFEGALNTTPIM